MVQPNDVEGFGNRRSGVVGKPARLVGGYTHPHCRRELQACRSDHPQQARNLAPDRFTPQREGEGSLIPDLSYVKAVIVLAVLALPVGAIAAPDERPNVVFLFADDWGRYAGVYREDALATINDVVHTPNIDALTAQGVTFWDAHASAPSCTPSRAAVLTGRHFYRNGSGSQLFSPWAGEDASDPVFSLESYHQLLEKAGYHTGVTYKTHVPAHLFVSEAHQFNGAGQLFNVFSQVVSRGATASERDEIKRSLLDEVRNNLSEFLAARSDGQPFAWYFSPTNTHRTWTWQSAQRLWALDPDDLQGKMPSFLPDNATIRQDMADYLGEVMAFDAAVAIIVDGLETRGLMDNTLLVLSGDHGAPGFPRGKTNLFDFGTQVPLIVHWPRGIANPGRRIDNPTSLIDLAPTFLEAAGLERQPSMDGRSVLPLLVDGSAVGYSSMGNEFVITGRERHYFSARDDWLPYPSRAIRTKDYLYIRNFKPDRWPMMTPPLTEGEATHGDFDGGPTKRWFASAQHDERYDGLVDLAWGLRPPDELYDLKEDPDQIANLATHPGYADIRERLAARLMDVLEQTGDPRVVGSGDAFDRAPYHLPDIGGPSDWSSGGGGALNGPRGCRYREGRLTCPD